MNYNNDKLNEIYRDTWPNLGWAARVNEDNLPVPDDMVWVNLTKEEIEELRSKKHTLTEYGKEQLRKLMIPEEMLETTTEEKKPFYRFFAIEYFATGEGMSFWLKVCRNYEPIDDRDRDLERFVKFIGVGAEHYIQGLTMPTEEEFMTQYANLIPLYIVKMIERRDQPGFNWETHFYFNYS
jgi:hypothetical protein